MIYLILIGIAVILNLGIFIFLRIKQYRKDIKALRELEQNRKDNIDKMFAQVQMEVEQLKRKRS